MKLHFLMGIIVGFFAVNAFASQESLVRFKHDSRRAISEFTLQHGGKLELVSAEGQLYKWTTQARVESVEDSNVVYLTENVKLGLLPNPSIEQNRNALIRALAEVQTTYTRGPAYPDNPAIKAPPTQGSGADPLLGKSWGMDKIDAVAAWGKTPQGKDIVVAVTDTGVDYNHQDLISQMWRNKGEIADDGIDNDGNGYVDDIVGWDFAMNDNKPYDLSMSLFDMLLGGGNPGHGTHVAGVIASRANNAIGTAGVAPLAKIMALRFITEKGEGSNEHAIKAIDYAVKNGANIINASWGGEKGSEDDRPLVEAIERAEKAGVIFVAAAGNGRPAGGKNAGFDNDNDSKPMVPASLPIANIVTVAALNDADGLAEFSNWGGKTVKLGAPGVKILSTVPGDRYQDTVIDIGSIKATWDGTSMAAPFVAGSLAVVWSQNPGQNWKDVRDTLLAKTKSVSALSGKVVTGGRLDLRDIK